MGNIKAEQTLERISKLTGQVRIDALIALLYSGDRTQLTEDQYMDLALPGVNEMSRLYGAASSNGTFEWPSEPLETRWRCFHLGSCETLDRDMYAPEDIADRLEESLSEDRLEELRNGSAFNDDEWRQVKEAYDISESESSLSVVAFETNDTIGRTMYFVADFGDWGTYLGCSGPYTDNEDLTASYTTDDDTLFEEVDECWEAFTPNWIEEALNEVPNFDIEKPRKRRTAQIDLLSYEYPIDTDSAFPNCLLVKPPFDRVSINDIDCLITDYSLQLGRMANVGSGRGSITFDDEEWSLADRLEVSWQKGRFHLGDLHLKYYWDGFPLHFHSDLDLGEEKYHLDLYGIGQSGPGRSRIDLLIFSGNELVARGSKGNQFIVSFQANLPLAFRTTHGLVIIPTFDRPKDLSSSTLKVNYWRPSSTHLAP